ncbi:MAG: pentapeptide repeat-containing protein [Thermomicrobiales bacterium]
METSDFSVDLGLGVPKAAYIARHSGPNLWGWSVLVEYESGRLTVYLAGSLTMLLRDHPLFDYKHLSDSVRVKVWSDTLFSVHELLEIVQFNQGARGLDMSGCVFNNMDLSSRNISELAKKYHGETGTYPIWFSRGTRRLDLQGLRANRSEFSCLNFQGVNLSDSQLNNTTWRDADLSGSILRGASLEGSELTDVNLRKANLTGSVMKKVRLLARSGQSILHEAVVYKSNMVNATFYDVSLQGALGFAEADLRGVAFWGSDLSGISFERIEPGAMSGAFFYRATLDRTAMRQEMIGEYIGEEVWAWRLIRREPVPKEHPYFEVALVDWLQRASEGYRSLKANFTSLGRGEDASWAHFRQRATRDRRDWIVLRESHDWTLLPRLVGSIILWATTGYGERPKNTIASAVGAIVAFGLIYWGVSSSAAKPFSFWNAMLYSGAAFFTVGLSGLESSLVLIQWITLFESALGVTLFGLYLWTLGNRSGRF